MTDTQIEASIAAHSASNAQYWSRFGTMPDFAGKRILDLGTGGGQLALEMANAGARVLGVDLYDHQVAWCREHIVPRATGGQLEFERGDITTMGFRDEFDLITSKDTFEHVEDLPATLRALRTALRPNGQIWVGFSPLYRSPFGDHRRAGIPVPWGHALLPWSVVRRIAAHHHGHPVNTLQDIELNGVTPSEFRGFVSDADLMFKSVLYNPGSGRLMSILREARKIKALESYATVGIYAVLVDASP